MDERSEGAAAASVADAEGMEGRAGPGVKSSPRKLRRFRRDMAAWVRSRRGYDEDPEFRARWEPFLAEVDAEKRR